MRSLVFLLIISFLFAFDEASYLKIEPSVRIASLGEVGVASARGISEVFLNPAGLSKIKHMSFCGNYMNWWKGIGYGFAGFSFRRLKDGKSSENSFGFSILGVNVEGIEKRNADGELLGTYGSSNYAFSITYSRVLFEGIMGGFNVKYLYENIDGNTAYGYAMDFGLLYWIENLYGFGLSFRNIGPGLQSGSKKVLSKTDFSPPMEMRIGGSYIYPTRIGSLVSNADLILSLTGNPAAIGFGIEFDIRENIYLRGGVKKAFGDKVIENGKYEKLSENTLSYGIGAGLREGPMSLDFAFYSRNEIIKPYRIGLTIEF